MGAYYVPEEIPVLLILRKEIWGDLPSAWEAVGSH